jgi:hypothetical protein
MTPEQKAWIDNASLRDLLEQWRFAKSGDPLLFGECGVYFSKRMFAMRDADNAAWVRASKSIGWDR